MTGVGGEQDKIINPSSDEIKMMIRRDLIPATGVYKTVNSTPSIMNYPSTYVIEYWQYWLSISVALTLRYILGRSIFVCGGSNTCRNGALNVVDIYISSSFANI